MKDTIIIIATVFGVILFIVGLASSIFWLKGKRCVSSYSNFQPEWGVLVGCRIMVNGVLTPVDIVRELK